MRRPAAAIAIASKIDPTCSSSHIEYSGKDSNRGKGSDDEAPELGPVEG